uniref:Uncharacterized protein n=1 Tax=viral metagenome TaxID=1070528 RepID=A0A6M3M614_9ZZZZ
MIDEQGRYRKLLAIALASAGHCPESNECPEGYCWEHWVRALDDGTSSLRIREDPGRGLDLEFTNED